MKIEPSTPHHEFRPTGSFLAKILRPLSPNRQRMKPTHESKSLLRGFMSAFMSTKTRNPDLQRCLRHFAIFKPGRAKLSPTQTHRGSERALKRLAEVTTTD